MGNSILKIVYRFHPKENYFTGWCYAQTDPIHPERILMPYDCTDVKPPVCKHFQIPVWNPDNKVWRLENRNKFDIPIIKNKFFRISIIENCNVIRIKTTCIDSRLFSVPSIASKIVTKLTNDINPLNCYYIKPCPVIFDIYSRLSILNQKISFHFEYAKHLFSDNKMFVIEELSYLNIQLEEIVKNIKRVLDQIVCLYYLKFNSSISKDEIFKIEVDSLGSLFGEKSFKTKDDVEKILITNEIKRILDFDKYEPFFKLVNMLDNFFKHHITYNSSDIKVIEHNLVFNFCCKNNLKSIYHLFVNPEDLVFALNSFLLEFCSIEKNNYQYSLDSSN